MLGLLGVHSSDQRGQPLPRCCQALSMPTKMGFRPWGKRFGDPDPINKLLNTNPQTFWKSEESDRLGFNKKHFWFSFKMTLQVTENYVRTVIKMQIATLPMSCLPFKSWSEMGLSAPLMVPTPPLYLPHPTFWFPFSSTYSSRWHSSQAPSWTIWRNDWRGSFRGGSQSQAEWQSTG